MLQNWLWICQGYHISVDLHVSWLSRTKHQPLLELPTVATTQLTTNTTWESRFSSLSTDSDTIQMLKLIRTSSQFCIYRFFFLSLKSTSSKFHNIYDHCMRILEQKFSLTHTPHSYHDHLGIILSPNTG